MLFLHEKRTSETTFSEATALTILRAPREADGTYGRAVSKLKANGSACSFSL